MVPERYADELILRKINMIKRIGGFKTYCKSTFLHQIHTCTAGPHNEQQSLSIGLLPKFLHRNDSCQSTLKSKLEGKSKTFIEIRMILPAMGIH